MEEAEGVITRESWYAPRPFIAASTTVYPKSLYPKSLGTSKKQKNSSPEHRSCRFVEIRLQRRYQCSAIGSWQSAD